MKLQGIWKNYHAGNCPLPEGYFVYGMAAGLNGRMWFGVWKQSITTREGWTVGRSRTMGLFNV